MYEARNKGNMQFLFWTFKIAFQKISFLARTRYFSIVSHSFFI